MIDIGSLATQCAPNFHPQTLAAITRVESGMNPFAIGVVGGQLVRQPNSRGEAIATAKALERQGFNFSLGVGQINRHNLARHGLDYKSAFDVCANLKAGAAILSECYARATKTFPNEQSALRAALSCYYSGNFSTGFRDGYVAKVVGSKTGAPPATAIPSTGMRDKPAAGRTVPRIAREPSMTPATPGEPSGARSALLF